jgi:serine/threonine protein kinase
MSLCINPRCSKQLNKDTLLFCISCGSELLLEGRYRVMQQLGGGGFGVTYEVIDSQVDPEEQSYLKVLKVLNYNHPKYVELFQREAQFLARLNHPGIPKVEPDAYFEYYPHNSNVPLYCFVMEKIEGLDLREYIHRRGSCISEKRAIQWMMQLASILREIHSYHFFHRDIKPSNIMLRADGQLMLIDFGTVREVSETYLSKRSAGQVTGLFSAGYSPLEQLNGQAVPQSDFFAMGRTFVYLLTGKHPNELYDSYADDLHWREFAPNLDSGVADFLDRLMARLPSQRPQSAEVIIKELEDMYRRLFNTEPTSRLKKQLANSDTSPKPPFLPQNNSGSTKIENETAAETPTFPLKIERSQEVTPNPLDANFISYCQQELAQFVGPMASILCQRILNSNSSLTAMEFIEALAKKIPDSKQAENFKKRIFQNLP